MCTKLITSIAWISLIQTKSCLPYTRKKKAIISPCKLITICNWIAPIILQSAAKISAVQKDRPPLATTLSIRQVKQLKIMLQMVSKMMIFKMKSCRNNSKDVEIEAEEWQLVNRKKA